MKVVETRLVGDGWICVGCRKTIRVVHIATSHDHTDECWKLCDCGAGITIAEAYSKVKNPTYPLSHYNYLMAKRLL